MVDEKAALFARVVNLKNAGVHQRHLFDFSFRTDGVGAFVLMRKPRHETAEQGWAVGGAGARARAPTTEKYR
eukprot:scaffold80332_cov21-Tisochrysis_lutea.AAC.1